MRHTLCQKMSYIDSTVDMSDERTGHCSQCAALCSDKINLADYGELCFGIVILELILVPVLAQERQDNRPQDLTHVRLTVQVSTYKHQICRSLV